MAMGYQHRHNEEQVELPNTKFRILKPCWDKIMGWAGACDTEVSGLGFVEKKDLTFTIVEVFLLKQLCGGSYTDLESDYYGKFGTQMISERMDDWNKYSGLRFWWHSHVNMQPFWSGTDLSTIERLSKSGDRNAWGLSMVVNKEKKYRMMFEHSAVGIRLDNLDVVLVDEQHSRFLEQCKKEVEEFVYPMSEYELDRSEEKIVKKTTRSYLGYHGFGADFGYGDYWSRSRGGLLSEMEEEKEEEITRKARERLSQRSVEQIQVGQFDDPDDIGSYDFHNKGSSQNLNQFIAESRRNGGFCPVCGIKGETITEGTDCMDNGDVLLVCPSCKEAFRIPAIVEV